MVLAMLNNEPLYIHKKALAVQCLVHSLYKINFLSVGVFYPYMYVKKVIGRYLPMKC